MSLALQPMALDLSLPWQADEQRENDFRKILKRVMIPLLLLFLIVPLLPKVDIGFTAGDDLPIRTQILLDPIIEPEPEPVIPEPQPQRPVAPVQTTPAETRPEPRSQPAPEVDQRESLVQSQGLAELSSQLNAVRGSLNVASLQNKNVSENEGGDVARTERARLGQDLNVRSTGTVVDETVMQSETTTLAAHQSAAVEGLVMAGLPPGSQHAHLSGQTGRRDMESIRRTLEQAKGNVYALYQRALLDDPGLTGEFTFKLVIEPNGTISDLQLLVSELGIAELERNILERIRTVNFGVMDVPPTVVEYRFVFLPS